MEGVCLSVSRICADSHGMVLKRPWCCIGLPTELESPSSKGTSTRTARHVSHHTTAAHYKALHSSSHKYTRYTSQCYNTPHQHAVHVTALQCTSQPYITLHSQVIHCTATFHFEAPHHTTWIQSTSHSALHYMAAFHFTALRHTSGVHFTTQLCNTLHGSIQSHIFAAYHRNSLHALCMILYVPWL